MKVGSTGMLIVDIPKFIHPCQVDPLHRLPNEGLKQLIVSFFFFRGAREKVLGWF